MKKCPTCEKTYDDNLRFCQTDGTPLVEDAPPPDPYATMVASKEEIMSAMPPDDAPKEPEPVSADEDDDLLDIPEESDSNKTMFVSDAERRDMFDEPSSQPIPPPSFGQSDLPEEPKRNDADTLLAQPEPPKFNEPDLNPPSFGDVSSSSGSTPEPPASPFGSEPPTFDKQPLPSDFAAPPKSDDSPFNTPIPSPFGEQMPPSYNAPSTPPFAPPEFIEEEVKAEQLNTPFAEEASQGNQAVAESNWTPPAAPDQSWQNQEIGQNTPMQPPPAGVAGENKTLALVSLVLGILSILPCCGFLAGIPAVIVGFMAKSKAENLPQEYGGRGLALGGIITGIFGTILSIILGIIQLMLGAFGNF
jgi:hypothetical protein